MNIKNRYHTDKYIEMLREYNRRESCMLRDAEVLENLGDRMFDLQNEHHIDMEYVQKLQAEGLL